MRTDMKLYATFLPILALSFSFIGPCQKTQGTNNTVAPAPNDKIFEVSVVHPEFKSVAKTHTVDGSIDVSDVTTITAAGPGFVDQILVNEGDMVITGDSIITISNTELTSAIELKGAKIVEMQAKLNEAKARLEDGGGVANQPMNSDDTTFLDEDSANAQEQPKQFGDANQQAPVTTLQAFVTYLEARISKMMKETEVMNRQLQQLSQMSPVTGIITKKLVSLSNKVSEKDKLLDIVTTNPLSVTFFLPQNEASFIYKSAKVTVSPKDAPDVRATGTVYFVSPNTDPTSGTIEIRAHIDNPENRIKGGQKANVSVSTNKVDRVVVLPKKVLVFENNKSYVFVVYKNQARLTEVTLGEETEDGNIQVYGDLRVDDPIITNRPAEMKDGAFVKTI